MARKAARNTTPNVSFVKKELADVTPLYTLIDDVLAGSHRVKKKGQTYLPMPNSVDQSADNIARYDAYKSRAVFYSVTRRTLNGFIGEMFAKDPEITIPADLIPLIEDATGEGVGIVQTAKKVTRLVLSRGRAGLFVDHPNTEGAVTLADLEGGAVRPVIRHYHPLNIINWRYANVGTLNKLVLVVLQEEYDYSDDGFQQVKAKRWRVLRLTPEGVYTVQVYDGGPNGKEIRNINPVVMPTKADGSFFSEIPFKFVGSETNDGEIDYPPLYDLADLNIAHYRNSADHEESLFVASQPTPVISGLTTTWAEKFFAHGVGLGSRAAIPLPEGATASLLETKERSATSTEMEHKERQMVALGARLAEQTTVQRTATETSIEAAGEKSTLTDVADNVSLAFEWAIYYALQFIRVDEAAEIRFRLNKEYSLAFSTPEARKEAIEAWIAEAISFSEMRQVLRKSGTATLPDKDARKEIQTDAGNGDGPGVDDADPADDPDEETGVTE